MMESEDIFDVALFTGGAALTYVPPVLLEEGSPPRVRRWNLPDTLDDEYALVSIKAYRRDIVHKPDAISITAQPFGAWAILPYAHIGTVVSVFLAPLMAMTDDKVPQIKIQPMTRDEILAMQG